MISLGSTGTSRLCRGLAFAASALAVASCASTIETEGRAATVHLFAVGYENIADRYIERVDLSRVSIAGLNSLSRIDPCVWKSC